jgi:hypothetical protein
MTDSELSFSDRIGKLLDHLELRQVHFTGSSPTDWTPLMLQLPERISSLTLVSARGISPSMLAPIESRVLLISGDSGVFAQSTRVGTAGLTNVRHHVLKDYEHTGWSDVVADRTEEITSTIVSFVNELGDFELTCP